jgi:hypothetical protein
MTEQTPPPVAGAELTDEQRAFLLARQATQAATAPSPAADQATAAAQMAQAERGPELPAESAMDQMMALIKAQSDQLASLTAQVGVMQKQAEEAVAASGGPLVIRYAKGAADKLAATAVAHPDLGKDHFAAPLELAGQLVDAATDLSKNGGDSAPVEKAAAGLERWLTKTHWREGRKFIDFSAVADDVETAVVEALKLAA